MSDVELREKIKQIIVEHLDVDSEKVVDAASFADDLGADSLDQVELVMKFEDAFNCDIPEGDAEQLRTVGSAINYISAKIN